MRSINRVLGITLILACVLVSQACAGTKFTTTTTPTQSSSAAGTQTAVPTSPPFPTTAASTSVQIAWDTAAQTTYGSSLGAGSPEAALFARASSYIKLYMSLPSANAQADLQQLEAFIAPSSTSNAAAQQLLNYRISDSQTPYQFFSQTILSVSIKADGINAVVSCKDDYVWLQDYAPYYKKGDIYTDSSVTENWQSLNGVWYLVVGVAG